MGVWETDGTLKWTQTVTDPNSGTAGASAFDFDNDGAAEVMSADEWGLHVFDGRTGAVKFEQRLGSCTGYETPVAADVDGDGRAEILAVANTSCGIIGNINHGIYVFGNDAWVAARSMWNQHTYHVTNVNNDATIPKNESPSWQGLNTYRCNAVAACPYPLPDLTASYLRTTTTGLTRTLTIRVGNGGANPAPPLVAVRFYDGDPRAGGLLLGVGTTALYLGAGEYEDVSVTIPDLPTAHTIWVVADDLGNLLGSLHESDEANNLYDSGIDL
jgi:hypothetical protein